MKHEHSAKHLLKWKKEIHTDLQCGIKKVFRLIILQKQLKTSLISLEELLEGLTGILRT